jgi:hypothetical protein
MSFSNKDEDQIAGDLEKAERAGGLTLIRALVAAGDYRFSEKVQLMIADGYYEEIDIEVSIRNGYVRKTESDELKCSVGNKKYEIQGFDTQGQIFYSVGKIIRSSTGKLYFVITAHSSEVDYV